MPGTVQGRYVSRGIWRMHVERGRIQVGFQRGTITGGHKLPQAYIDDMIECLNECLGLEFEHDLSEHE